MKNEDQVCSPESARRFRELGIDRDSLFVYISVTHYGDVLVQRGEPKGSKPAPAYTVSEMLETAGQYAEDIELTHNWDGWIVMCPDYGRGCNAESNPVKFGGATTLAEAVALWIIWLIENGHLSAEDINGQ